MFAAASACNYNKTISPDVLPEGGKSDITYQMLVYSFADSNGDQIGDFRGIINHLDYLEEMGVSAIWLSPIHKASSYHGYDVLDYDSINPLYGTEDDFKALLDAAHNKGIKIYLDYVLNHTSKNHPWFLNAKKGADSQYRDYYIFSNNPAADIAGGKIAMISTEGSNGYDSGQWYSTGVGATKYHSHFWTDWFADLNYGSAATCEQTGAFKAVCESADRWINMGVDGFRLDAVKHIYHNAGSNENPTFLKKFYEHCNASYKAAGREGDIYMVGEQLSDAWSVAPYYKGLPALFEFSFWWTLRDAINGNKGNQFCSNVLNMHNNYNKYRENPIAATKLSNHDEDRTGSYLGKSANKEKLAACVLLTCEGEPYIYQGEELGYYGVKTSGDEYVRTPILWSQDLSTAAIKGVNNKYDREMLVGDYAVDVQEYFPESVLNTYRTFGKLRKNYKALCEGTMTPHPVFNNKNPLETSAAVWYMTKDDQTVLVLHNFSDKEICLDLPDDKLDKLIGVNGYSNKIMGSVISLSAYGTAVYLQ